MEKDAEKETEKRNKYVRQPKQTRSMDKKEKILEAALELFCEKGYFNATTNEIAQRAQVSIGSLYSYFKDKDTIFLEILDRYHEKFPDAKNGVLANPSLIRTDVRAWLRILMEGLIKVHEESKALNRELNVLSYYNPRVAEILSANSKRTMQEAVGYFFEVEDDIRVEDIEATATVIFDLISATVHRIVFGENEIERDRLIDAAIDVVFEYLRNRKI